MHNLTVKLNENCAKTSGVCRAGAEGRIQELLLGPYVGDAHVSELQICDRHEGGPEACYLGKIIKTKITNSREVRHHGERAANKCDKLATAELR